MKLPGSAKGEEADLVRRAQQGDALAFGALYEQHVDRVYAYIAHRVGSRADVEDITEEVFLRTLANLSRFRWQGSLRPWLLTIVRNLVADHWRRRSREGEWPSAPPTASALSTALHARSVASEQPDPAFRSRLRYRLEGAAQASARPRRPDGIALWRARLLPVAIALLVLFFVVEGAASSLPGSPLYPLKRAVEDAHLALTPDHVDPLWLRLNFAERRLLEVQTIWEQKGTVWEGGCWRWWA